MSVTDYEREFVRFSKYARECVSIEAVMCKRFEDELNEDICLYVRVLELKEIVVSVDRACKVEELVKEKRRLENESRGSRERQLNTNEKACFRCGSLDHFIKDCPEVGEKEKPQNARSRSTARGRPLRNPGHEMVAKSPSREQAARVEGRAPARTYAIRAREEASSPNVITRTFSLHNTRVIALIDLGSTHSYICMKLVSSMSIPIESTEFTIRVSNPLGKCMLVDGVCIGCPLMIKDHCFHVDLMLLPFDEFYVILGIDWLVTHGVIVNCGEKHIELRDENGNLIRVESDKPDRSPVVMSILSTQKYLRKGYEAYLAFVLNTKETDSRIESVPTVYDYPDVFPEELPGLPPVREIEFGIELAPDSVRVNFGSRKWDFVGHIVSGDGIRVDPSKISAIVE
ncbi:RVP_2 domain-containing protein [Gossypium australe]|uniref:RVP_2 domain-containing protein n=1 Tax=Gossypium australe TaxID=47621 RepID=A0A5B6WGB0_9ROSI|nr:RVP_2 domain-containing protein [Gossypium australe]